LPSVKTALSLIAAGELREVSRRVRAYALHRPLVFADKLDLSPHYRPQNTPIASTPGHYCAKHPKRVFMAGPSLRREGAPISQFELVKGLSETTNWQFENIYPQQTNVPDNVPDNVSDNALLTAYEAANLAVNTLPILPKNMALPKQYEQEVQALATHLKNRTDLVYANTLDMFPVIDAARLAGIPSVWNIRESEPWRARLADRHPAIARRALACFDYPKSVIFVARSSMDAWRDLQTRDNFSVIANALCPDQFLANLAKSPPGEIRKSIGAKPEDILLLSVGTLCERKRQADGLAAFLRLAPDITAHIHWIFLGAGPKDERAVFLHHIPEPLRKRIHIIDSVENTAPYYKAADIFVSMSAFEAMPRSLLEAQGANIPIITTPVFGAGDYFSHGINALFFPVGDVKKLANTITLLVGDPQMRKTLSDNYAVQDGSDYHAMISAYAALFAQAVKTDFSCAE